MEVFAVINMGLHHDSSYYDIVGIFSTEEKARTCMGCEVKDFTEAIQRGDFGEDFNEIEIDEDMFPLNPKEWDEIILSTSGYYEAWKVEPFNVQ